jgi:trigger factor
VKATAEKAEKNTVNLQIEVDAQEFEKAMAKSYIKNKGHFTIPGFRKGKAPRKLIERYYGEAIFYEDAFSEIFPDAYSKAVEETGIKPVDQPELDIQQIGSGQNLIFTASVTVKPEVKLGQYKGIEIEKVEYNVTDEDVEAAIKNMQERNARWIDVEDRSIKEGDLVTLDFSGSIDGVPFDGGSAENYSLEIGSGSFIPGFEEQLIGLNKEEEKDIVVTFPEDYNAEELKGKEAVFEVKIHEIKEKELPHLDDEFAKDVSEFDTLDEYRVHVKETMDEESKRQARSVMENQLIAEIADAVELDIPEVMIERQIDNMLMDFELNLYYRGLNLQRYLELMDTSMEDFRAQYRDQAYTTVKSLLVMEEIGHQENIEATEEEVEQELNDIAKARQTNVDQVRKQYAGNMDGVKDGIVMKKTIDFLMDNAILVDKKEEPVEEDTQEAGQEKKETIEEDTQQTNE